MKFLLIALFAFIGSSVVAQEKTDNIKVYGNCEMCKNRIEKAATKIEGVTKAEWNVDSKVLTIAYDAQKTNLEEIQKKIAAVGHDTEKHSAENEVYKKLPGCCKYERKGKSSGSHAEHKH